MDLAGPMLGIDSGRINDPKNLSPSEIAKECEARGELTVQFSRAEAYTPATLVALNEACRLAKGRLKVRFYGHHGGARFDAKCLRYLPETYSLSVDCLGSIENEDEIGRLPNLRSLSLGIFELNRPDFLTTIQIDQLDRLSLGENRNRNFDLSPLADGKSLNSLFIQGHSKGISVTENLSRLRTLTLSGYAKKHGLNFVEGIPALRELTLLLGGRTDLGDLKSKTLEILQVIRVRGLATMGDLSRLPALSALRIEDQIQLKQLDLNGTSLKRLTLNNCKNLVELLGLDKQDRLSEFSAHEIALDLDDLRDRAWPSGMRSVWLFSGSGKWNDDAEARLAVRNLNGERTLWP